MSLARVLTGAAGLALAAAAFAVPAQAAAPAAPAPIDMQPMIIDGEEAADAPWAVRLLNDGQEACTATAISPDWVLTAQHCVEGAGDAISFKVGSLNQHQGEEFKAKAGGVHVHDSVDLALVNVDRPMNVEFSPLGSTGDVSNGDTVQVYGWGATCTDQPEAQCQAENLKVADVKVTDIACTDYRGGTAVCADRVNGITAGGDSGGPMFSNGTQVGVASTSDRATTTAYTNVTEYRDWIKEVAGV
ncbi:trypsin-like serine protease [Saccharopolyspora gloriosae]|uniref:S1 family peptidase n=1 Tax=Saccharopolyspora gloriosae TaxID=455344 RepID=UPI001FB75205|nr:trypsin-like serine protease [Saccharopolyspora gloriosae]